MAGVLAQQSQFAVNILYVGSSGEFGREVEIMAEMLQRLWNKMDAKARDWIANRHKLIFVVLCVTLLYAAYCMVYDLIHKGFRTPTVMAFAALAASTYTAWWTHWLPPDVFVTLAGGKETLSEHERLTLLYYNRGTSSTYVTVESIDCKNKHFEVVLKDLSDTVIEPRSHRPIHFYLRPASGYFMTRGDFPIAINVSFIFWRDQREVNREEELQLELVERRHFVD